MSWLAKKSSSIPNVARVRAHPGQRRLHRLLHHLAELAGHGEAALALHLVGFDEEDVAAGRRPRQADGHARTLGALGDFAFGADLHAAQHVVMLHQLRRDHHLVGLAFGDAARLLAADGADGAFEVANAGFARVVANDEADRLFRELDLLVRDAVLFDLPRDQVLEGDVHLLFFGVALQLDDLHAIAQRLRQPDRAGWPW